MKSYADLIQSGLLALLGGDDENATFEELPPKTPQGWQSSQGFPQAGSFGPQGRWGERAQKLPYIPSQHEGFGSPSSAINDLVYRPGQYPGPIENHIQLYSDKPKQAQGAQAGQEIPYYMVGRRPLGKPGGMGSLIFNGPKGGVGYDHNARLEHQHFIGSDGSNFGFTDTGEFEEKGREKDYAYDVPNIGNTKFKAKYMDMARLMVGEQMQIDSDKMKETMEAFSIEDGEYLVNSYHAYFNNCQDYVDKVISTARELARRNGDTLEIE